MFQCKTKPTEAKSLYILGSNTINITSKEFARGCTDACITPNRNPTCPFSHSTAHRIELVRSPEERDRWKKERPIGGNSGRHTERWQASLTAYTDFHPRQNANSLGTTTPAAERGVIYTLIEADQNGRPNGKEGR